MLSRLIIAALWSPAGKGLTSLLLFVMFNCVFVAFPCGILGQGWYLIVSIPDICRLSYFDLSLFPCSTQPSMTKNRALDTKLYEFVKRNAFWLCGVGYYLC